ncbi:MAG: transcription termination factor NusA [Candidatus Gracilibacteria bacterium]|nr:transcription termination factor NusA [Candidatus Gracilibacteria bacterium]
MLDLKKIQEAVNFIADEKKISKEVLVDIIEAAIKTAYKKDYGDRDENVLVKLDIEAGKIEITLEKILVKEVTNPSTEISFEELGEDAEGLEEGEVVEIDVTDELLEGEAGDTFGRIASQAARQVIIQKIGETEKQKIYDLFKNKLGEVLNMKVIMTEYGKIVLDYNGNQVVLPKSEQVSRDEYIQDARFYVYVSEISNDEKTGPRVTLSRKNKNIVTSIFALYVPELADGTISIDKIVRYPGVKSKILVSTNLEEIDAAGTLIGPKGTRVKSVMEELSGEKIDIINSNLPTEEIIVKSLTPAEILKVEINEEEKIANVYILPSERAKAIGKNGININLASQICDYTISLVEITQ